jgi:hypothetical protein
MKNMIKLLAVVALILPIGTVLTACFGGGGSKGFSTANWDAAMSHILTLWERDGENLVSNSSTSVADEPSMWVYHMGPVGIVPSKYRSNSGQGRTNIKAVLIDHIEVLSGKFDWMVVAPDYGDKAYGEFGYRLKEDKVSDYDAAFVTEHGRSSFVTQQVLFMFDSLGRLDGMWFGVGGDSLSIEYTTNEAPVVVKTPPSGGGTGGGEVDDGTTAPGEVNTVQWEIVTNGTGLLVSWQQPESDGGNAILHFVVTIENKGPNGTSDGTIITSTTQLFSYTFNELEFGFHEFTVAAVNSKGAGEAVTDGALVPGVMPEITGFSVDVMSNAGNDLIFRATWDEFDKNSWTGVPITQFNYSISFGASTDWDENNWSEWAFLAGNSVTDGGFTIAKAEFDIVGTLMHVRLQAFTETAFFCEANGQFMYFSAVYTINVSQFLD